MKGMRIKRRLTAVELSAVLSEVEWTGSTECLWCTIRACVESLGGRWHSIVPRDPAALCPASWTPNWHPFAEWGAASVRDALEGEGLT